ncbi:heavy metal-binding domain-containing protein [Altererythrobacter xixiisoli]|uniref:Heavy metal-binding domain-containing protein n=2 Tax=Croceibacterium xixiisoli TaxID=1476466 RepID=A0A6I4TUQ6_9SPHN|nr:heavy metal-binding domain-containing protein [Croceibacterium xixiisoli]
MPENCGNCGATITTGSAFKLANLRRDELWVRFANFINSADYSDLCGQCGDLPISEAHNRIDELIADRVSFVREHITDFPMFTISWLPANVEIRYKTMITANVTVGTGLFNEFSQGFSDFLGCVNTQSGMSAKVNQGEANARSILVSKALAVGANCVVGVDIDYGVTNNNSATINMQGTAAHVKNMSSLLHEAELERAQAIHDAYARIDQLRQWRAGDIPA